MDHRRAEFVRYIGDAERLDDLIDEAKADTWTKGREHAVLIVRDTAGERLILVRGGHDGILLDVALGGTVAVEVEGAACRVLRLAWHVHPRATGPSDHDRAVLAMLGQESSMLYEIGGPAGGTLFRRA